MLTTHSRLMALAVLSAALLAGCGGNSDYNNGALGTPPGPVAQTITDVAAYINGLIAGTADSSEPVDIDVLTLAADNNAEPAPLP